MDEHVQTAFADIVEQVERGQVRSYALVAVLASGDLHTSLAFADGDKFPLFAGIHLLTDEMRINITHFGGTRKEIK